VANAAESNQASNMNKEHPESGQPHGETKRKVTIKINGTEYQVHPGNHPVSELRTIPQPNIPKTDKLCQFMDGEFKPLDDHAHVQVKGGETFASNCPSGGAS